MTTKAKSNKSTRNFNKLILISIAAFCLGYYMLNYVATWEKPLLGNTFHIVIGCAIMAVSLTVIAILLKKKYFPTKKKKQRSKHVFLKDTMKNKTES